MPTSDADAVAAPDATDATSSAAFEPLREVRFGVVMYGGVSLAVYINGVSQELFSLVRATAPSRDRDGCLHHADGDLSEVEKVYRKVGRLHAEASAHPDTSPVRTRFVVDIVSGSSAGGINAVYLGKALANQQEFARLRELWVEKGDVAALLNDRRTRTSRKKRLPDREPVESLFSGDVMYLELLDALDEMDRTTLRGATTPGSRSPYVDDLDVWITATHLEGIQLPIWLADKAVEERQHRHSFHFAYGALQPTSDVENDFAPAKNPILAFAARATSSFPFAFAPAQLRDIARVLQQTGNRPHRPNPTDDAWAPWFAAVRPRPGYPVERISFGDGGDMDNKPFSYVVDTLPIRTSSGPVDRRLIYIEPDPGHVAEDALPAPRPDTVASTLTAVSLGRFEAIRDDLDRLARISQTRERIRTVKRTVDERYDATGSSAALLTTKQRWIDETPDAMAKRGLAYAAYYRLRIDALINEYARSLVGLRWHAAETPESAATTAVVRAWVTSAHDDPYDPVDPAKPTTKHFLNRYDVAFRIRRLAFVANEADRLHLDAEAADTPDDWKRRYQAEVRRIKNAMALEERRLRQVVPSIRSKPDNEPKPDDPPTFRLLPAEVDAFRAAPDAAAWAAALWASPSWATRRASFTDVAAGVGAYLDALFRSARTNVKAALGAVDDNQLLAADASDPEAVARADIWGYYARFDDFDQVLFPLQTAAGSTGEDDGVEVYRFSPVDAESLVDRRRPKVAGARLGHFGGFLDATWRSNDIMWGRLDAAEQIIDAFAPAEWRQQLLDEAQDAILREEWYAAGRRGAHHESDSSLMAMTDDALQQRRALFRREYRPPPWPETSELMAVGSRAAHVTSAVLESVSSRPGAKVAHRIVAALAWFVTALSTVVFPRNAWRTPVRFASAAALGIGGGLIALGSVLNWDAATSTGWPVAGAGLAALVLSFVGRMARRRLAFAVKLLLVILVLALAGYGGWQLWDQVR